MQGKVALTITSANVQVMKFLLDKTMAFIKLLLQSPIQLAQLMQALQAIELGKFFGQDCARILQGILEYIRL